MQEADPGPFSNGLTPNTDNTDHESEGLIGPEHLCRIAEVADRAERVVRDQESRGGSDFSGLSQFDECIYLKNSDGVVVFSNEAHQRHFSHHGSPVGRTSQSYLEPTMAARGEKIASLLQEGCVYVECEFSGPCPDGCFYRIVSHKRSLKALESPGLAILGVLRLNRQDDGNDVTQQIDLVSASTRFRELSDRDQEMCRLTALGISSRELGERLGMTTRGIELRKQKAFAKLGVAKAVDLARLLTRLQDRGYLDLGL
ncbi:helix-turn-helix transcriptional regulator [Botrimarina colliarenosi]|nr:LuxR C-terminal-related transcriptional regulator [Botrimarina colliarenosi]